MADRNVTIRISAQDSASNVLRNVARELDGVDRKTRQVGDTVSKQPGLWNQMGTAIQGAVVAFGAMGVLRVGSDMVRLGQQVTATRSAFERLSGGAGEAAANLEMMRAATRGGADDLTLMQGANRLLIMNLAETGQEAARLTEIAVTLGRVMGQDASQAIESFSLMLSNRSIPRLDNFGISASAVRERIQELKDAGMGLDEAFTMAVLEQGEISMDRLGDAVEDTVTAVDRLEVRWANLWTNASQNVAIGVNSIIENLDRLVTENPQFFDDILRGFAFGATIDPNDFAGGGGPDNGFRMDDGVSTAAWRTVEGSRNTGRRPGSAYNLERAGGSISALFANTMRADAMMADVATRTAEALEDVAERGEQAALSLSEMMNIGRYPGAGGEAMSMIMEMLPEDQREAFGVATGLITPQEQNLDAVTAAIAGMSGQGQVDAAIAFAQLLNSPGAMNTMIQGDLAGIMGQAGYFQGGGGDGTTFTIDQFVRGYDTGSGIRQLQPGEGMYGPSFLGTPWANVGSSTLGGIYNQLGGQYTMEQLMAAAGTANANLVQPGTYSLGGGGGWQRIVGGAGPMEQGDAGWGMGATAEGEMIDPYAELTEQMSNISTDATTWREAMTVVGDTAPDLVEPFEDIGTAMPDIASAGADFAGYCEDSAGSAEDLQAALETMAEDIWAIQIELTGPDASVIRELVASGVSIGGSVGGGGGGSGGGSVNWRDAQSIVNGDSGGVPPGSANTGGPVGGSPLMPGL
jgi:hypothetical protein